MTTSMSPPRRGLAPKTAKVSGHGPPKAYPYLRWSSDVQTEGHSRERQEVAHAAFAKSHGLALQDPIIDGGVSAKDAHNLLNGALATFLAAVQRGEISRGSYLLIEDYDRFSRAEADVALAHFLTILSAGIYIGVTHDGTVVRPGGSYTNLIIPLVKLGAAHEDNENRRNRTRDAWAARKANAAKQPVSKRCPAWLEVVGAKSDGRHVVGGKYKKLKDRCRIVHDIFTRCANGVGLERIARDLNTAGVAPFGGGQGWYKSAVAKIIRNRAVLGEYQPHTLGENGREPIGEAIQAYPAVINLVLFNRAQRALSSRRHTGGAKSSRGTTGEAKKAEFRNLFSGLPRCCSCRGPMTVISKGQPPKGGKYFICDNWNRRRTCLNKVAVRYEPFEAAVLDALQSILLDVSDLEEASSETKELALRIAGIEEEIAADARELDKLYNFVARLPDGDSDPTFLANITRRKSGIADLQKARGKLVEAHRHAVSRLPVADEIAVIRHLRQQSTDGDHQSRYLARARLASAIRAIVSVIAFHGDLGIVEVCNGIRFAGIRQGQPLWGVAVDTTTGDVKWPVISINAQKMVPHFDVEDPVVISIIEKLELLEGLSANGAHIDENAMLSRIDRQRTAIVTLLGPRTDTKP